MRQFFNVEGPFFTVMERVANHMILSFLFAVFSLPVVTMGPSICSLYYTVNKVLRSEKGYIWQEFIGSFRRNLRQTLLLWLVYLGICAVLGGDLIILYRMSDGWTPAPFLKIFIAAMLVIVSVWEFFMLAYAARFEDRTAVIMKNAAAIMFLNLPSTALCALLLALTVLLVRFIPVLVLILPSAAVFLISGIMEGIFKKYQ